MSVEKRTRGGKVKWLVRYRDSDGRQRAPGYDRKADADLRWAQIQADRARGEHVGNPATVTVAEWAREHWGSLEPSYRDTTIRGKRKLLRRLEADPLGGMRLRDVRQEHIRAYATRRAGTGPDCRAAGQSGLSPLSLRLEMGYLRSLFRAAVEQETPLILRNPVAPAKKLRLPRAGKPKIVPLTVDQVAELAGEVPARYRALILTQAGLGLRLGEVLALRVQDVNFPRLTVRISDQLQEGTLARVPPKYDSWRTLPLPHWLSLELSRHIQEYPPGTGGLLFTVDMRLGFRRAHGPVDAVDHHMMARNIRRAVARCGLPPGTRSHDLRHHYASVLAHQGLSVYAIAEMLGHKDAGPVLETYGHLMPGSEEQIRQAVERAWADPATAAEGAS